MGIKKYIEIIGSQAQKKWQKVIFEAQFTTLVVELGSHPNYIMATASQSTANNIRVGHFPILLHLHN